MSYCHIRVFHRNDGQFPRPTVKKRHNTEGKEKKWSNEGQVEENVSDDERNTIEE